MDVWPMLLAARLQLGSLAPLALAGAVTTLVMLRLYVRRRTSRRDSPAVYEVWSMAAPTSDARQWQIDLHDYARDVRAQLDNRLSMLQHLLREADARIARLEKLTPSEDLVASDAAN